MAQILLVGFDKPLGDQVALFLQQRGHRVKAPSGYSAGLSPGIELVIVDVSCKDAATQEHLVVVADYREQHGGSPMFLCVSRVYRGPRFELDLEKRGARLVYV